MPATRSSSKQPSASGPQPHQSAPMPYSSPRRPPSYVKETASRKDVIILSSDEDELERKKVKKLKPKTKRTTAKKSAKKAVPVLDDVLEITSSDDDRPVPPPRKPGPTPGPSGETETDLLKNFRDLQQEHAQLQRKLSQLDTECEFSERTIQQLHHALATQSKATGELQGEVEQLNTEISRLRGIACGGQKVDVSKLEDHISCEVCTLKMWSPFILPDCGHTFCQSCLTDWFGMTLAQYTTRHPAYNPRAPAPDLNSLAQQMLTLSGGPLQPYAQAFLSAYYQQVGAGINHNRQVGPGPEYSCPTCRKEVRVKPVEDFKLKALVREVAGACG
ncbi:hypothetical protein BV22DRAFT_1123457, partial [Leucogyrophana mollusca]